MFRVLRLRTKITLYFLALMAAWGALLFASQEILLVRAYRDLVEERGVRSVRALAAECAPLASYEDLAGLKTMADGVLRSVPDARYALVFDGTGSPLASTFAGGGIPPDLLRIPRGISTGGHVSVVPLRSAEGPLYDFETVRGGVRVRLGLGLNSRNDILGRTTQRLLWIGLAGFAAVFGVAFHLSRPVEELTRAVERAVDLDHRTGGVAPAAGTIETATIAQRFQALMSQLEDRTRQLDASRKLAYLGKVSANIAHEVNNPLGTIVMNADFLARRAAAGELPPAAAKEAERLQGASRRVAMSVRRLLLFARHPQPPESFLRRPTAVDALVRETLDLMEERILRTGGAVRVEIPPDYPSVPCDAQGIQQVLINLLTNALDAGPPGGSVLLRAALEPGAYVLEVVDRGSGMSEEVLRRAREPFFTTKEPEQGTGLGLAVSDAILHAHGGELRLASRPGEGTTATIRLPRNTDFTD